LFFSFAAHASRLILGLPENWVRVEKWLSHEIKPSTYILNNDTIERKLKNPELAKLSDYSGGASQEFWNIFPKSEIPTSVKTSVNVDILEVKIEEKKSKLLTHQYERAKKR